MLEIVHSQKYGFYFYFFNGAIGKEMVQCEKSLNFVLRKSSLKECIFYYSFYI